MRKLVALLLLGTLSISSYSQPCKEENIKDKKKRLILEGFIVQSGLDGHLTQEKGIVWLGRSSDAQGQEVWSLSPAMTYNVVKANADSNWIPGGYYNINGWIVLILDCAYL